MSALNEILNELKVSIKEIAINNWNDYKNEVISDGNEFLDTIKDDLEKWITDVQSGKMTKDDMEWLVKSKKDLAQLTVLKNIGLAKAKLDKISNDIIDSVSSKMIKLL